MRWLFGHIPLLALLAPLAACATVSPAVSTGPGDAPADDATLFLGRDREATFQRFVATLGEGHLLSTAGLARLGTTWPAELERTRERFLAARTRADVYYALLSLKNTLHDGHSDLVVPDALRPKRERLELPLTLRAEHPEGGELTYVVTQSGIPGVREGAVLETIDGRPVAEHLRELVEWHRSSSPEHLELELARWLVLRDSTRHPLPEPRTVALGFRDPKTRDTTSAKVEYTVARENGATMATDPDYVGRTPTFVGLNYAVYPDPETGTLVVRYFSFQYDLSTAQLWNRIAVLSYRPEPIPQDGRPPFSRLMAIDVDHLAAYLRSAGAEYSKLLIDLRENSGGGVNLGLLRLLAAEPFRTTTRAVAAVPLLAKDPVFRDAAIGFSASPAMVRRVREDLEAGRARSSAFAFDCRSEACPAEEATATPAFGSSLDHGRRYTTALFTGPYCLSSCDQFASIFLDNHMGEVVGQPPQGASAPFRAPKKLTLANGETFTITLNVGLTFRANGELLEANPAVPTRRLPPGRDGLAAALRALAGERTEGGSTDHR